MEPLFLTVVMVGMASPIFATDPKPPTGTPVGGVGVMSPDGKLLFVPAREGGIEALAVATGKVIWTNGDAKKVAGASDTVVLGWVADDEKASAFRLVVIDAESGKTVVKSDAIEMPGWATTGKTLGRTFRTAAHVDEAGVVVVWRANAFYAGGARPTPQIEAAARKQAVGVVTIDTKTGKVAVVDRKPKDEEFGQTKNKVGNHEFRVSEQLPGFKVGAPMKTTVTLSVLKDGKEVWTRELAGNPWSPPPP